MIILPEHLAHLAVTGTVTAAFVKAPYYEVDGQRVVKWKPRVGHSVPMRSRRGRKVKTVGKVIVDSWFETDLTFVLEESIITARALTEAGFASPEEFAIEWIDDDEEDDPLEALSRVLSTRIFAVTFHPDGTQDARLLSSCGSSRGDEHGYNTAVDEIDAGEAVTEDEQIRMAFHASHRHHAHRQEILVFGDLHDLRGMPGRDARAARRKAKRGGAG